MSKLDFFKDLNEAGAIIQCAHILFKSMPVKLKKSSIEFDETLYGITDALGRMVKDLNEAYRGIEKLYKLFDDGHAKLKKQEAEKDE